MLKAHSQQITLLIYRQASFCAEGTIQMGWDCA